MALLTYGTVYLGQTVMLFSTGGVMLMQDGWSLADSEVSKTYGAERILPGGETPCGEPAGEREPDGAEAVV
ncbi:hypothetical protein HBB89_004774 [Salmonella enterica]|uniref:Uncharacterized protein n=2 Tax=Salmonella TaxID=590 RepID=A0A3Y4YLI9_SALET|nr:MULTISPECIES: hypothetical protein [Salmonella]AFK89988.1 hypothetical protein [Salmonella sp. 14]EAB7210834.1 hypothetical protein [Salmonella enterica subsp. enterica serovar Cotham]EBH9883836.1 hypothetical protein [Salmonella enterica subsp. enterica serovar Kisarawe]EBP4060284.1 hypothetical protein [Salmonella enterica subsp. enterica]ECF2431662.1 hypothetical protein [Salmonella enterica subsp. enterica serovar Beaudesert]ECT6598043.1 hypothetical protein [Salmonella enterica subsp.